MVSPEQRSAARSFGVGVIVFAIIGAALFLTFKAQTGMPFAPTTTVTAAFKDVHSLAVNDDVRQNSRRIGRVAAIEYKDGAAVVTMELEGGDKPVYSDARAAIWDASALSAKFVELHPGSPQAGPLSDQTIPVKRTTDSADIYELLNVLDKPTREAASTVLREVGGGVAGHSRDLHDVLASAPETVRDIGEISGALASPEADLQGLIAAGDQLVRRFSGREQRIADLIRQSEQTLRAVATDQAGPLTDTLNKAPTTLRTVRSALDGLDTPLADTQTAMSTMQPGARALGASADNLRGFLREGAAVAEKVPGVAAQAEPALDDLRQTVADARPLAPRVTRAFNYAATPLQVLAPYAPEIAQLFVRGHSFMSQGPAEGIRFARLSANPAVSTVTGGLFESGNYAQNQYPEPGEADHDRVEGGLPPGLPVGGGR